MFSAEIGVDLGTANVFIYLKGEGIVLREPSVIAYHRGTNRVVAVGQEAQQMIGRTPADVVAVQPLRAGVVADYQVAQIMLQHFIRRVAPGRLRAFRPRVLLCVPSASTDVERRAVVEAAREAGAKEVKLVSEPMAAAIGAGLDVVSPRGSMVVDVGGGTTDIGVISLGDEVISHSARVGGNDFDESIVRCVRRVYNLIIGERMAEEVKVAFGSLNDVGGTMEVRGRDVVSGLPKAAQISGRDVSAALAEIAVMMVDAVRQVLERVPPELAADIGEDGIALTGGGAQLGALRELIAKETGLQVNLVEDPSSSVALGMGMILEGKIRLNQFL
ncbi:MAG: rod shape-determining protein [Firmicutes bacterium]|jgi:rod shape-determining protein MreB|nr:rod shape-determining protein [Bacillota bacterium]